MNCGEIAINHNYTERIVMLSMVLIIGNFGLVLNLSGNILYMYFLILFWNKVYICISIY
ncbi:uncharacterized protein METZ01_LOCUS19892 [marine metagenome]|uniref:Uncharacterized protein n=1 Tax=marine metagenome TaxID=408172 RepID=A0A381PKR9_9ZZZZ